MKRFLLVLVVLSLSLVPALSSAGNLADLQQYMMKTAPNRFPDSLSLIFSGEIVDIYTVYGNHWEMKIKVDDPDATVPIDSDFPYVIGHFRLHLDECPFKIGDTVEIEGSLNTFYSTVLVPSILCKYINDSNDF